MTYRSTPAPGGLPAIQQRMRGHSPRSSPPYTPLPRSGFIGVYFDPVSE